MGRDKALIELDGAPLLVRMVRLAESCAAPVTVVATPGRYETLGVNLLAERWPGEGPLGGIVSALSAARAEWNLILGCDLPYLTREWLAWLAARALESPAQAVVPESRRGLEPLAAIYRAGCAAALAAVFERGVRSITDALGAIFYERVAASEWEALDPEGLLFRNVNTPEDFAEAQRRLTRPAVR